MNPFEEFMRDALLWRAATALYPDGYDNPYKKWNPGTDVVKARWDALSDEDKAKANRFLERQTAGNYEVHRGPGDRHPIRVALASPLGPTWDHYLWPIVCAVCGKFRTTREEMPIECPNCKRVLRAENIKLLPSGE